MQKRNIEVKYGNTEETNENSYTFVIPNEKYKNISIKYDKNTNKKKETKGSKK